MNKPNVVDINSQEFEKKVLEILSKQMPIKSIRFHQQNDGWIKDLETGKEWGKSSPKAMTFNEAQEYCEKQGGRLPTRAELESLQDLTKYDPCIEKHIFSDTKSEYYWSQDPCAWSIGVRWCVSFYFGHVNNSLEIIDCYVRPVRASQ